MSAFKGTPGPWEVVNGTDVFTPLGARTASGTAASITDGWHIADCCMGETETDEGPALMLHAERLANARLIAAAPELLEALLAAVDCGMVPISSASEGGASAYSRQVQVADQIRAAIAKATGGDA